MKAISEAMAWFDDVTSDAGLWAFLVFIVVVFLAQYAPMARDGKIRPR